MLLKLKWSEEEYDVRDMISEEIMYLTLDAHGFVPSAFLLFFIFFPSHEMFIVFMQQEHPEGGTNQGQIDEIGAHR